MKPDSFRITNDLTDIMMILHKRIFNPSILARRSKISPAQLGIMFTLLRIDNPSVSQLAHVLRISKPNMTPLLDSLIELGYIKRDRDEKDRRILRISLTKEGKSFYEKMKEYNSEAIEIGMESLTAEEAEEMARCSSTLLTLLKKIPPSTDEK
ncbi:MAG: MarR family transcriptional regulator [Clostridiaceae bacterium]